MKLPYLLRNEAADNPAEDPNLETEGFMSRLDKFIESGAHREPEGDPPADPPARPAPVDLPADDPPANPPAKPDDTTPADDLEEDDLPSIGDHRPKDGAFDEEAFDKETEKEVAGLDPKQAAAWRKIKTREKEARKRAAELEEKVKNTSVPQEVQAELGRLKAIEREAEALRQRNEELLRANDQTAVRESPEYKQGVEAPLAEMKGIIAKMGEVAEIDPRILAQVIEEPDIAKQDKMLDALSEKLSPRALNRLERLSDDYKAIMGKEKALLENAGKTIEESRLAREREAAQERARRAEAFKLSVTESFTTYAARIPGFTDSSGALTDIAEAAIAKTETIDPTKLDSADLGYMAFAANALPELRRAYVAQSKELAMLKAGKRREPMIEGDPPSSRPPAGDDDIQEDGMPEGLMERFQKQRFDRAI